MDITFLWFKVEEFSWNFKFFNIYLAIWRMISRTTNSISIQGIIITNELTEENVMKLLSYHVQKYFLTFYFNSYTWYLKDKIHFFDIYGYYIASYWIFNIYNLLTQMTFHIFSIEKSWFLFFLFKLKKTATFWILRRS